jgi:hypothetical protein
MRHRILAATLFMLTSNNVHSQVVVVDQNIVFQKHSADVADNTYDIEVFQDAAATDGTSAAFKYGSSLISPVAVSIDEGSDWYVVQPGGAFSKKNVKAGQFTPLITYKFNAFPPANVGGADFYLGVSTSVGSGLLDDRNVFGWVHLRPENGELKMVRNSLAYGAAGIIVGTATLVPEPSMICLGVVGCALLAAGVRTMRR